MSTFDHGADGDENYNNRPLDAEDSRIGWFRKRKRVPKQIGLGRRESRENMSFRELAALSSSESEKEENEFDDEHDSDNDNDSAPSPLRHKQHSKDSKRNPSKPQKPGHLKKQRSSSLSASPHISSHSKKLSSPQRRKALDKLAKTARSKRGDKRDKDLSSRYAYEADTEHTKDVEVAETRSERIQKRKSAGRTSIGESIEKEIQPDETETHDDDVVEIEQFHNDLEQPPRQGEREEKAGELETHDPDDENALEDEPEEEEDTGDVTQPEVVTALDPYFDQTEFLQTLKSMR